MKPTWMIPSLLLALLLGRPGAPSAQEAAQPAAAFELESLECGELDHEGKLLPLRASHPAGEDLDLLCKVKVTLPPGSKGAPRPHTVTLSVYQAKKTTYQQVREARVVAPGSRLILFVVPAEKLPTEGGKVQVRAELSRPAGKPPFRELTYELNAED